MDPHAIRTKIDNSNADHWQFPIGTQIRRVFSPGGIRVETRYMVKLGPGEDQWSMVSYAWHSAPSEAVAVPSGQENANRTSRDIPSRNECRQCHERIAGPVPTPALGTGEVDAEAATRIRAWINSLPVE